MSLGRVVAFFLSWVMKPVAEAKQSENGAFAWGIPDVAVSPHVVCRVVSLLQKQLQSPWSG